MQHQKREVYAKQVELFPRSSISNPKQDRIAIAQQDKIVIIDIEDILYLKADNNYTHIIQRNGDSLIASITLKRFEQKLPAQGFLRVHQSFIIQARCVKEVTSSINNITLHDATKIPVSRSKRNLVLEYLKTFMV